MEEKKGDKAYKEGDKQITVSLFNWSKDYASAASYFEDAFKSYKKAGAYEKAVKTLKQLILCNEKMIDSWGMARNYQAMVDIYLEHYPVDDQVLIKTATDGFIQFRMAESLDKGLQIISKVTKYLTKKGKQKEGMDLLQEAYRISLEDEKSFKKKQIFGMIVQSFLDNDMYEETIKMYYEEIKRKNGEDCEQDGLIVVILELILGEAKRAENEMFELGNLIPNFLTSNECESAENLIKSYRKGQPEVFKKQTTKAAVTTIFPVIIIRKLRNVVVPSAEVFETGTAQEKQDIVNKLLF